MTYICLARREERAMIEQFGEDYTSYRARTPSFVPSRRSLWVDPAPVSIPENRV